MAFKIPDWTALGEVTPRPSGQLPVYPQEDPGAAGLAAFGKGLSSAGGALVDIGEVRNKLNESNATLDLVNRLVPLHTQISTETDPNKIADLRKEYDSILPTSSQALADDPDRQRAWMAKHAKIILDAHADADKRLTLLDRGQVAANGLVQLDQLVRNGVRSNEADAISGTLATLDDNLKWRREYGADTPAESYALKKRYTRQLLEGRADHLMNQGRSAEALQLLDEHPEDVDPVIAERLRHKANVVNTKVEGESLANFALGLGPAPALRATPRSSGGMQVGGAIGNRIAQEAERNNIDPKDALATAQIESSMGRNLGSRGNIFQLGKPEWSAVGGGPMGDPDTDIKNGLAWMGKVKNELGGALGREPEGWEIYLAHQQGVGGAASLLANPDKPAGQLVPARNISANGGDPSAPASAFVGKWRATFQRTAANVAGAVPASGGGAPSSGFDQAIGDSIAVQQVNHGVGGSAAPFKSEGLGPAGTTARVGDSPEQVLQRINTLDKAPATVFLSSGASNNPDQAGYVGDQIDALKAKGATNIVVPGVGPGIKNAAAVNASLKNVVESHGGIFFVPDVKWQKDGVHPAEVDKVRAQGIAALAQAQPAAAAQAAPAADQIVGQTAPTVSAVPATPAAPPPPEPAQVQNRTGLPSLREQWDRVWNSNATPEAKAYAWEKAKSRYSAEEAEAARSERIIAARQKQALEARITAIQKDAYSDSPTITARDIVNDPTFNSDPKLREHMIAFINNPPGSGVPAPQSQAAAYDLVRRINLPEGNPDKITEMSQLTDPDTMRRLNKADFEFAVKQFNDIRAPGGERLAKVKDELVKAQSGFITKSNPLSGEKDPVGESRLYEYERYIDTRIDELRKQGKDPNVLFNPKSPDFVGDPSVLRMFQPTLEQSTKSKSDWMSGVPQPLRPVGSVGGAGGPEFPPIPTKEDMQRLFPETAAPLTSKQPGAVKIPGGVEIPLTPNRIPGETPEQYLQRRGL